MSDDLRERCSRLTEKFQDRFSTPGDIAKPDFIARAPGRVNIIGEHTDYNDGFVLPCALPFDMLMAVRRRPNEPNNAKKVVLHAVDRSDSESQFHLHNILKGEPNWSNYIKGVAWAMQNPVSGMKPYMLQGVDIAFQGNVPVGSGLSSSAALEVAACKALAYASGHNIPGMEMAQICRRAENDFVGVPSGIMDQFISAVGQKGSALFLDCRDLSRWENIPFDLDAAGHVLVVADTRKRRALTEGVYAERVQECANAVAHLSEFKPGMKSLRDITIDEFHVYQHRLSKTERRRVRHVLTENARVLRAVEALKRKEWTVLGALMNASHDSLRDDYECCGPHLDAMVRACREIPGVLGSRMTGAGFGGCTVSLMATESLPEFADEVPKRYTYSTGLGSALYTVTPSAGASIV